MKNLAKQQKGFTIIEVLIVLAIAGLIILIVFLAVPALQRNSRNTQRREDVSKLASAVVEWSNNNNGKMPSVAGTERADAIANAKLGFYDPSQVSWATTAAANENVVVIATDNKCNGEAAVQSQTRAVAVRYKVETGNGTADQCEDS